MQANIVFALISFQSFTKSSINTKSKYLTKQTYLNENAINNESTNINKSYEITKEFLNKSIITRRLCLLDSQLRSEMESANFWTVGSFTIEKCECTKITKTDIHLKLNCIKQGKPLIRNTIVQFPYPITNDNILKTTLIIMAKSFDCISETKSIINLPFGQNYDLPVDFRFNQVPHAQWVRNFLYNAVRDAVIKAIYDNNFTNKSRMQVKFNIPEGRYYINMYFIYCIVCKCSISYTHLTIQLYACMTITGNVYTALYYYIVNIKFDTYRVGTILECVRHLALALALDEGKRVRICVQQSLGEGVFTGLPLALASMRPILEKMDWYVICI